WRGAMGEWFGVWGERGGAGWRRVVFRQTLPLRRTACDRHPANVVVGAPSLVFFRHSREHEVLAVRAERVIVPRRKRVRGRIGVAVAGRHVLGLSEVLACAAGWVKGDNEQVLPLVLDVLIPVAEEQLGEDLGLDRVLLGVFLALLVQLVALVEGFLRVLRPDRRDERNVLTVGRPDAGAGFCSDVG